MSATTTYPKPQWPVKTSMYVFSPEKAMAPHSSTLARKIPWMEEPGRLQSMGSLGVGPTKRLHFHFSLSCIGEGNGNPLRCSCLENPRDGEAWWAAVYGVAQSRTRLKRLSSSSSRTVLNLHGSVRACSVWATLHCCEWALEHRLDKKFTILPVIFLTHCCCCCC